MTNNIQISDIKLIKYLHNGMMIFKYNNELYLEWLDWFDSDFNNTHYWLDDIRDENGHYSVHARGEMSWEGEDEERSFKNLTDAEAVDVFAKSMQNEFSIEEFGMDAEERLDEMRDAYIEYRLKRDVSASVDSLISDFKSLFQPCNCQA